MELTDATIVADVERDAGLIERARRGDADAFSQLVTDRLSRLLRTAKAIVSDVDDAAEIVQETFVSAWVNLPSLRDSGRFDAWLNRILTNRCRRQPGKCNRCVSAPISEPVVSRDDCFTLFARDEELISSVRQQRNQVRFVRWPSLEFSFAISGSMAGLTFCS